MRKLWRSGTVDEAVLGELRAIRQEIHDLSERVSESATRADLGDYVRRETFAEWTKAEERRRAGVHTLAPYVVSGGALVWAMFWTLVGQHLLWH